MRASVKADHRATLLRRHVFSPGLFSVTFRCPPLAGAISPGQFAMVEVSDRLRPYLRRAYSIADAEPLAGTVEFLIKTIGAGTAALEEISEGSQVRMLGPLGNSFGVVGHAARRTRGHRRGRHRRGALPDAPEGAASRRGSRAISISAGATRGSSRSGRASTASCRGETVLASDDGSLGEKGFVTEALARRLASGTRYARRLRVRPDADVRRAREGRRRGGHRGRILDGGRDGLRLRRVPGVRDRRDREAVHRLVQRGPDPGARRRSRW